MERSSTRSFGDTRPRSVIRTRTYHTQVVPDTHVSRRIIGYECESSRSYIVDCGGTLKCRLEFTVGPRCFVPVCFWGNHTACFLGWFVRLHRVLRCDRSSTCTTHILSLLLLLSFPSPLLRDHANNKHITALGAYFCHQLFGA